MKTLKLRRNKLTSLSNSRWAAYATAGAATAVGCAVTTEDASAAIHYSGPINQHFSASSSGQDLAYFNLGGPSNRFGLVQTNLATSVGAARFGIFGAATGAFAGFSAGGFPYVSKLNFGANINGGNFAAAAIIGTLAFANGYGNSQWLAAGTGFIGFRFNGGSGIEYGWARVTMDGAPNNSFTLVDYAWGDIGDAITAGQTTSVPEPGSLGLLALGGAGLVAWRKRRAKAVAA